MCAFRSFPLGLALAHLAPILLIPLPLWLLWPTLVRLMNRTRLTLLLLMASPSMLFGCGTVPLPASSCPPVPAALMTPSQPPVLLVPASPSPMSGATTPKTPPAAPKTAPGTSA